MLKTIRINFFILCAFWCTIVNSAYLDHQAKKTFKLVVEDNRVYPTEIITRENNHYHLLSFPTFVEVTENGINALNEINKSSYVELWFSAVFSEGFESVNIYSLNRDFFRRVLSNGSGFYQPDYLYYKPKSESYNAVRYTQFPVVRHEDEDRINLYNSLKENHYHISKLKYPVLNGLTLNPDGVKLIFFLNENRDISEEEVQTYIEEHQNFTIDGETRPLFNSGLTSSNECNILLQLGGEVIWGYPFAYSDTIQNFPKIPFDESLRGIVFSIDAIDNKLILDSRPLSDEEAEMVNGSMLKKIR